MVTPGNGHVDLGKALKGFIVSLTELELDAPPSVSMYVNSAIRDLRYALDNARHPPAPATTDPDTVTIQSKEAL